LALSSLVSLGRRTISGLLCTSAQQFKDWSAAYRLFAKERYDREALFTPARQAVLDQLKTDEPLVVMMDDTLIHKRGRNIPGTGWKRDPLGPHFCTNFVWGQRFLQVAAALPDKKCAGRACSIPINFIHAPSAKKPGKRSSVEEWSEYRKQQKQMKVSSIGAQSLKNLRVQVDSDVKRQGQKIICAVDGGFTNQTVLRDLPEHTTAIGRIRKDAKLFSPPSPQNTPRRGRTRWYGAALPTPEQIRQDDSIPWQQVEAFAAGKRHIFDVKIITSARWVGTGHCTVQIVVIRPLAYRLRNGSKLLYRNPAYLICTDQELPIEKLLQSYLWRWEIEVNFRDEKTLLGVGEAQVRTPESVENVPAFIVAAYAFLLLAGTYNDADKTKALPRPKWQQPKPDERQSTQRIIGLFRSQLWDKAMMMNLTHFASENQTDTKPVLLENSLTTAVCYAAK
jgi:hypothetical protein